MIRKRIGVLGFCALCLLLAILFAAAGVLAQTFIDVRGGRIADGIELPFCGNAMYAYAQGTAPVISKIELEGVAGSIQAGSSFKVALTFEETQLTFQGCAAVFKNVQTGSEISAGSDKTALADNKYIKVTVPDSAKGGVYTLERIVLLDSNASTHIYYNPEIYASNYSAQTKTELSSDQRPSVTVISGSNDTAAPQVGAFEIEKSAVLPGEELIFAVEAKDLSQTEKDVYNNDVTYAASGLNSIRINWQRTGEATGTGSLLAKYAFSSTLSFADLRKDGDVYQGTFKIPARLVSGTYYIKSIEIDDKAGNSAVYVNPYVDVWDGLFGSTDTRNHLESAVCAVCINVSSDTSSENTTQKTAAKKSAKSENTGAGEEQETSADKTVVISTVESFSLNSFGKMAAYVVLKAEEADILDTLEDDEREYAEQNFRFSVSADSDAIEENSSVAVGRILSGDTYENAKNVVKSRSLKSVVFDIDLRDESGTSVQPDGVVSVSTDLPEDFDKSKVSVYRLSDDGKKCYKLDSTISGERVMFTTDHFSVFVISEDADSTVSAAASPRTADDAPIAALAAVLVGAIAVIAVNLRKSGYC